MNVHPDVNFEELARSTDDFNGAQLKAVCVEAGMLALRRDATEVLYCPMFVAFASSRSNIPKKKKISIPFWLGLIGTSNS